MKNVTYTTLILFLLTTISVFASNTNKQDSLSKSIEVISLVDLNDNNIINIKNDSIVNTVSYLTKYQYRKSTSRKSKMNNILNFLKNPEKKEKASNILC